MNSVCRCFLSEKVLCTNELIADCFVVGDNVTQHVKDSVYHQRLTARDNRIRRISEAIRSLRAKNSLSNQLLSKQNR